MVIVLTLVLSLFALIMAISYFGNNESAAYWLTLIGGVGVASATYALLQIRKRVRHLAIEIPPITTTVECRKCGFKSVREFQRGDYVFKDTEPCQKCNEKMMITAIYREVKDKEKERPRF
jgi:hypothetical protein